MAQSVELATLGHEFEPDVWCRNYFKKKKDTFLLKSKKRTDERAHMQKVLMARIETGVNIESEFNQLSLG